jgi:hypothetical protein
MIGILFHMLNGLFANLGAINSWSPVLSAVTPSALFLLAAITMIWWVEIGAVSALSSRDDQPLAVPLREYGRAGERLQKRSRSNNAQRMPAPPRMMLGQHRR